MRRIALIHALLLALFGITRCSQVTDNAYSKEYAFQDINNDSLYHVILNSSVSDTIRLISLRDSISGFEKILKENISVIESINSLSVTPDKKRDLLRKHFSNSNAPSTLKQKFININEQIKTFTNDSEHSDSLVVRIMPLNLLKMSLQAEFENIKAQERKILIGISENIKTNEIP